jgi:hypothetical protein
MEVAMRKTIPVLLASAAVALPLALAGAARAAPLPREMVLYDASGTPVAILRPITGAESRQVDAPDPAFAMLRQIQAAMQPDAFFPADLLARQDAMLRQAMQAMERLAAAPMPAPGMPGMIEAALGAALGTAPGTASQVVVTSFSAGNGTCSQTVTYAYPGNGAAPWIAVRSTGDACGTMAAPTQPVPAAAPAAPEQPAPRVAPDGSRLIQVDYPHPAPAHHRLRG